MYYTLFQIGWYMLFMVFFGKWKPFAGGNIGNIGGGLFVALLLNGFICLILIGHFGCSYHVPPEKRGEACKCFCTREVPDYRRRHHLFRFIDY